MAKELKQICAIKSEIDLNALLGTGGFTNPSIFMAPETGHLHVLAKSIQFDRKRIWFNSDWDQAFDHRGRIAINHIHAVLDRDFGVVQNHRLEFRELAGQDGQFHSADDVRMISWQQKLFLIGSCMRPNPVLCHGRWRSLRPTQTRMFLAPFPTEVSGDGRLSVAEATVLPAFFNNALFDKNWITHEHNPDDLLLGVDINRNIWIMLRDFDQAALQMPGHDLTWLDGWSGSTNLIDVSGSFLGIVHRKSRSSPCVYNHMFVVCDKHFRVLRRSVPFTFEDQPVEFAVGLTLDVSRDEALIAYGVWDREARLVSLSLADVLASCSIPVSEPQVLYGVESDAVGFYRENLELICRSQAETTSTYYATRRELLDVSTTRGGSGGSLQYWRKGEAIQNFGDFLSAYFAEKLFRSVDRSDCDIHVVGSVLSDMWVDHAIRHLANGGGEPSLVAAFWGCGLRDPRAEDAHGLSEKARSRISIRAVRGPLTARHLELPADFPQGDPGLLMPYLYTPIAIAGFHKRTLVVPHFLDTRSDWDIRSLAGADMVLRPNIPNALEEIERFTDRLCSSSFVLAGSLHAAVIAAAYGVPFAFWDSGCIDLPFKWQDFAASIMIPCAFQPDVSRGLTHYAKEIAPRLTRPPLRPLLLASPYEIRSEVLARVK